MVSEPVCSLIMNKIHGVKTYQKYIEMGITMTTLKEDLIALGIDYNKALERFLGKPDFYQEFLYQFPDDPQLDTLLAATKDHDVKKAFKAAHTLKGLCGNLGLNNLLKPILPLVEILRKDSFDGIESLLNELVIQHKKTCDVLELHRNAG